LNLLLLVLGGFNQFVQDCLHFDEQRDFVPVVVDALNKLDQVLQKRKRNFAFLTQDADLGDVLERGEDPAYIVVDDRLLVERRVCAVVGLVEQVALVRVFLVPRHVVFEVQHCFLLALLYLECCNKFILEHCQFY